MKVYLVRHAQSEENVLDLRISTSIRDYNDIVRRSHERPLTELGEKQAQAVADQLATLPVAKLYSSPFIRALATAKVIGEALHLTPHIIDELREVLPPPMNEHRRAQSLGRLFIRSYIDMLWQNGDESWRAGYVRAKTAWQHITAEQAPAVVAVAHRGLIALILLSLRNSEQWRVLHRDLNNCGVSVVEHINP